MSKIEDSVCYGKVMFSVLPVVNKDYEAVGGQLRKEGFFDKEFRDLYQKFYNYKIKFQESFVLLSPTEFNVFHDIHLQRHFKSFELAKMDFINMGLILKSQQSGLRFEFLKVVINNEHDKRRQVYMLGMEDTHKRKWYNALQIHNNVNHEDRVIEHLRRHWDDAIPMLVTPPPRKVQESEQEMEFDRLLSTVERPLTDEEVDRIESKILSDLKRGE